MHVYRNAQKSPSSPVVRSAPKFFTDYSKTILGAAPPNATRGGDFFESSHDLLLTFLLTCRIIGQVMKSSIHPQNYRPVVFSDDQAGFAFLTQSTAQTAETIKWEDGNEYPLVKIHISSASHPYFTGEEKIIDTEGRVDRFKARAAAAEARKAQLANKAKKAAAKKAKQADEK